MSAKDMKTASAEVRTWGLMHTAEAMDRYVDRITSPIEPISFTAQMLSEI